MVSLTPKEQQNKCLVDCKIITVDILNFLDDIILQYGFVFNMYVVMLVTSFKVPKPFFFSFIIYYIITDSNNNYRCLPFYFGSFEISLILICKLDWMKIPFIVLHSITFINTKYMFCVLHEFFKIKLSIINTLHGIVFRINVLKSWCF